MAAALWLVSFCALLICCDASKTVMPYMGLEFTGEDISADLVEISKHVEDFEYVSPEHFNLGENSTLLEASNLTNVIPQLRKLGIKRILPLISTFHSEAPHRRTTDIDWVRQAISNPQPFIDDAIALAKKLDIDGYAFDFEPQTGATEEDGQQYPGFLSRFSDALRAEGFETQVNVARWSLLYNYTLLGKSSVDRVIVMDTYCSKEDTFREVLANAIDTIGVHRLVVGLMTTKSTPSGDVPFTYDELKFRFDLLEQNEVEKIGIWEMPVPANWFDLIAHFLE